MDNNNNIMNQPLTSGADAGDSMSQTSSQGRSRLQGSLLDRIRAQRSRDDGAAPAEQGQMIVGPGPMAPSQISIPTYRDHITANNTTNNNMMNSAMTSTNDMSELGSSSMMSTIGFGSAFAPQNGVSSEALLGNHNQQQGGGGGDYSMTVYFKTFVMDVYSLFQSLPVWAQVVLIIFLVFLVIKWI
ncbi:expressed unknown protein [Seminavis robusta]|uniref:Uncharacterized protein n=1 Tax=Seminavis robusta TaxID=568900 RepID=A0A9N8HH81_9STRA|nr:expressed unknown protein [Seminavis robusta]|eukprot:Sro690_g187640.1 n/a (186) ;mRNA; r:29545-30102